MVLQRHGGTATWAQIREQVTQHAVRRALDRGEVTRVARGRYALPTLPDARQAAARLGGVVSHVSAAEAHRLPLLVAPAVAWVTVPPNRQARDTGQLAVRWRALGVHEVRDGVTTPLRTVLDCAATVPFAEALAVADGAVRLGLVATQQLVSAASQFTGRGAPQVRRVALHADGRAANPFESALRALALDAGCSGFEPQLRIEVHGGIRVDLGDVERRIALEADSFEWHGDRGALRRDCRRYDELVRAGWRVLRFAWEDVMFDQGWVRSVIADVAGA